MALAPEIIGSIVGAGSGLLNTGLNALNMGAQTKAAKDLMNYQWKNFQSPKAQVAAMGAAGLNAGALLGEGKGSFASPSVAMPSSVPAQVDGVASMANYLTAVANAKKAGVETSNLEVERQSKQFELELSKFFSAPAKVAEITLAWKNVMLANDEHNIKAWQKVKEEMLAGLSGVQKKAAEKEFANMDTVIEQQNRQREEDIKLTQEKQKTEGTQQTANRAVAANQRSQVEYNRESARLQRALADIEDSGKSFKLEALLKHYRATGMLDDASYEKAYKLFKNLSSINADNDKHSWNQAADDLFYYLGEKIHQISPIGGMLDIDYTKK